MLNWVSSWWSVGSFTGPARNAPNNGIDIKKFFDQRPTQVISLSAEEVKQELSKLRPTKINAIPPLCVKPPLMAEFDNVFNTGYKEYFEARKRKRIEAKTVNAVIISITTEISCDSDVISHSNLQSNVTSPEPSIGSTPIDSPSTVVVSQDPSIDLTLIDSPSSTDCAQESSIGSLTENSYKSEYVLSKEEILAELVDFQNM